VTLPSNLTLPRGFAWRLAATVVVVAVLWAAHPPADPHLRLCGFYWLTGRPCPLCGLTRSLCALAKLHWSEAFHFHALSPLGLTMLLSLFWEIPQRGKLWTAGLVSFGVYGVVRLLV